MPYSGTYVEYDTVGILRVFCAKCGKQLTQRIEDDPGKYKVLANSKTILLPALVQGMQKDLKVVVCQDCFESGDLDPEQLIRQIIKPIQSATSSNSGLRLA